MPLRPTARNSIRVNAPPEAVFGVLADARSFARWVVGSRTIRRADPHWPETGATFDHTVGLGPLTLSDSTTVQAAERPHTLRLLVRARPLSRAVVTLSLRRDGDVTDIDMEEYPADRRSLLLFNPLTLPLVRLRNAESLRRLRGLAEGTEPMPDGELPSRETAAEGAVKGDSRPAAP